MLWMLKIHMGLGKPEHSRGGEPCGFSVAPAALHLMQMLAHLLATTCHHPRLEDTVSLSIQHKQTGKWGHVGVGWSFLFEPSQPSHKERKEGHHRSTTQFPSCRWIYTTSVTAAEPSPIPPPKHSEQLDYGYQPCQAAGTKRCTLVQCNSLFACRQVGKGITWFGDRWKKNEKKKRQIKLKHVERRRNCVQKKLHRGSKLKVNGFFCAKKGCIGWREGRSSSWD